MAVNKYPTQLKQGVHMILIFNKISLYKISWNIFCDFIKRVLRQFPRKFVCYKNVRVYRTHYSNQPSYSSIDTYNK